MSSEFKYTLFSSLKHLLRPVVRVMLRHGITFAEFAEIARAAYVDEARDGFSLPGKKATDSRIAVLTGLSRKQVKKIRETPEDELPFSAGPVNRATRVLSGWHQDSEFTDSRGLPLELPLESLADDQASFESLVRRYSGDMTPRAMLDELTRVAAVEPLDDGLLRVKSRSYIPANDDPVGVRMMGTAMHDLGNTIAHNIDASHKKPKQFQRMVLNERLNAADLPLFERYIEEHGQKFLEMLDDWLSARELPPDAPEQDSVRAGFGIYLISKALDDEDKANED